ncbi:MAG: methylated-DNA--[protein]-cysteine S-methyltransferase [Xanthobacteraceae bacterium]
MPPQPDILRRDTLMSPIGTLVLVTDQAGILRALDFEDYEPRMLRLLARHCGMTPLVAGTAPDDVRRALRAYFDGDLAALRRIRWATSGTDFQRSVWAALTKIPVGTTRSYQMLAAAIARPRAVRAVGLANGSNPVAIVVPCHRVIGANGTLTGYGGGLQRKRWLLEHEGVRLSGVAEPDTLALDA